MTALPSATARAPPGQKSFCTSTTMRTSCEVIRIPFFNASLCALQCRIRSNALILLKKRFHIGNVEGHAVGRQAGKKGLSISLAADAGVKENQDTAIFERPDEAAKALLQRQDGFGDLVI